MARHYYLSVHKPCPQCGGAARYTASDNCVNCHTRKRVSRLRDQDTKAKMRQHVETQRLMNQPVCNHKVFDIHETRDPAFIMAEYEIMRGVWYGNQC